MPDHPEFNLVDEAWVPALRAGEHLPVELSLRQVLREMGGIDRLACDPPIIEPALLRLLLAIVIDAKGGVPRSAIEADEYEADGFDLDGIDRYLDVHRHRFDLFDPEMPFAQVVGLATATGVKPVSLLTCTLPAGNGVPLFVPIDDGDSLTFTPAQAARWLLTCHLFDGGAIKSGAVGDPAMKAGKTTGNPPAIGGLFGVTIPEGRTLAETLMVNIPFIPDDLAPDDAPWWLREHPTPAWQLRRPKGILDQLTWQSRRIRLEHTTDGIVTGCVIAAGDRIEGFTHSLYIEPHVTTRYAKKDGSWRPILFRAGKAAWRELEALVATKPVMDDVEDGRRLTSTPLLQFPEKFPDRDIPITVAIYGVNYDANRASVTDLVADRVSLPTSVLLEHSDSRALLMRIVEDADELRLGLNNLDNDLRRCVAAAPNAWDQGDKPGDRFVYLIDAGVRRIFAEAAGGDHEELAARWRRMARGAAASVADEVFASYGPRVFSGYDEPREGRQPIRHRAANADRRWRARLFERVGEPDDQASEKGAA